MKIIRWWIWGVASLISLCVAAPAAEKTGKTMGEFACNELRGAQFEFDGPMARRIAVNLENWLLILNLTFRSETVKILRELHDKQNMWKQFPWEQRASCSVSAGII